MVLLVTAAAAPAYAYVEHAAPQHDHKPKPAPVISVGLPDDPQVQIVGLRTDAREVGDTALVTVQVELAGPVEAATGRMALTLPKGASVVGLTFARGAESLRASARAAPEATVAFEQTRMIKRDPALLEQKDDSLQLSLYPITAGERPTATVTIAMPRFRVLEVGAPAMRRELVGGTFDAPTDDEVALAHETPVLSTSVSLLAMPPPSLEDFDVRLHNYDPQVQACARMARIDDPSDVTLTVVIGADGNVTEASAGDSEEGRCLGRLAATWRFGADEKPIAMHLRLHLSPG